MKSEKVRYYLTISLLLATAAVNFAFPRPEAELERRSLSQFPKVIGDWRSMGDHFIDDASMSVLNVDDYIMRTYRNSDGDSVGLYIGYFLNQREDKQVHSPRQCLPGAGWGILKRKIYLLKLKNRDSEVSINYYLMGKGPYMDLYLWWYQGRGRIYANEYLNKFYLILDSVRARRTDGALVRLNSRVTTSPETALQRELQFIHLIEPMLAEYIPD